MQNNVINNLKKGIIGFATVALVISSISSCKKSSTSTTQPTANTLPPVSGADAVMAAVNV